MSRFRLLALDIDGTLLSSARVVSERTRRAVQAARMQGVGVVLVTGRRHPAARRVAEDVVRPRIHLVEDLELVGRDARAVRLVRAVELFDEGGGAERLGRIATRTARVLRAGSARVLRGGSARVLPARVAWAADRFVAFERVEADKSIARGSPRGRRGGGGVAGAPR